MRHILKNYKHFYSKCVFYSIVFKKTKVLIHSYL